MAEVLGLADFAACRRFIMTGCGRVPASLFHLHDWTDVGCPVGVERAPGLRPVGGASGYPGRFMLRHLALRVLP
jgi:hypothetical protein